MKKINVVLPIALIVLLAQSAHAIKLRIDQFKGYNTGNLGADGNTGSLNGWNPGTATPGVTVTNGSGSLDGSGLGLVASKGDKVSINTNVTLAARNQFLPNSTFPQTTNVNIYYSFLYRFNAASDVTTNILMRLNRANSGAAAAQHWDLIAKNVAGQIQLGLFKAVGNVTNYATTNISQGQTFFAVVRQQIISGATNDIYDLWINPPAETFSTNEANVPPPSVSVGALASDGTEDSSATGPGRLTIGSGFRANLDELRIATNWAEATPFFGQCLSAGVIGSPASQTNSAELAFTFQVTEDETSPTFQWQVSTNGGASFFNIPGADDFVYTTPNLALTDTNRYRAIVNVDCNGSSATSAVATVTLTTPTPTPAGLLMNDTFTDPGAAFDSRNNTPLSATNSLWYTDIDESDPSVPGLYAYQQNGNLVGKPKPGASSLWLGYFVQTNQVVHLAVGSTIKVTLPFTPDSFTAFTNNASLRIGMFDYFDTGVTRITNDSTAVGGSQGNAIGVRGYLLNLDFGTNFSVNSPLGLFARNFLQDNNLMGSIGDYVSYGSGPDGTGFVGSSGGGYSNAPAFQAATPYTLVFKVTRTDVNSTVVSTTISGGGTNWSHSIADNTYAYHRFDSFALRPNSLETVADSITFPQFAVEVLTGETVEVPHFSITNIVRLSPTSVKLTWESLGGATYYVVSSSSLTAPMNSWTTNATVPAATGDRTSYTNSPISGDTRYYRVLAPPFTP